MARKNRLRTLERRLDQAIDRLTLGVEALVEAVVESVGMEVVEATPVDTGFARGNWRPSLNAPATVPISILDPTGAATISRINTVARLYKIGDTVFLVNRAPYIESLNEGSSPQAEAEFIQTATQRGVDKAFGRAASEGVL